MTFTAFVKAAEQAGETSFWGYARSQSAAGNRLEITDLTAVTPERLRALADETRYTTADLEAGYRTLCAAAGVKPGWPPRVYP